MLHPSRRRAALARLGQFGAMERVLVLCYGNICRSPYAAMVLSRALTERGVQYPVEQGGFFGPGRPTTDMARAVAGTRGIDLGAHRSRLVTMADVQAGTLVIVMEAWHAERVRRDFGTAGARIIVLGDLDPQPIESRAIIDPYGRDEATFAEVYARIDRCLAELVRGLGRNGALG
jgi:protein-tyrosine-phosphatase